MVRYDQTALPTINLRINQNFSLSFKIKFIKTKNYVKKPFMIN